MKEIMKLAEQTLEILMKQPGVVKAQCYLERTERTEIRFSLTEPYMLRTVPEESAELVTMDERHRVGRVSVPSVEELALNAACADCAAFMREAKEEPDFDLAGEIKNGIYRAGDLTCDTEKLYRYMMDAREKLPGGYQTDDYTTATHYSKISVLLNSNGAKLAQHIGWYEIEDHGVKIRDLDVDIRTLREYEKPFDEQKWEDIESESLGEKFVGTVLLAPSGVAALWWHTRLMRLNDQAIIRGNEKAYHPWLNAKGEKLVSEKLTICENLLDPRLAGVDFFTKEGYPTQNIEFVKNGVIGDFPLSAVAAKKLGRPCNAQPYSVKNGHHVFVEAGDTPVRDILNGIEQGLLLKSMRCTPDNEGEMTSMVNGALLIEHGKITRKINCALSCNFFEILKNVSAVSKERHYNGERETPWIAFEGIHIS
ncbi:MAG: hypothetical protein IJL59_04870 [Clostridia bacterium]|nr:hypothetical protein [Clostridia bacterium]